MPFQPGRILNDTGGYSRGRANVISPSAYKISSPGTNRAMFPRS